METQQIDKAAEKVAENEAVGEFTNMGVGLGTMAGVGGAVGGVVGTYGFGGATNGGDDGGFGGATNGGDVGGLRVLGKMESHIHYRIVHPYILAGLAGIFVCYG